MGTLPRHLLSGIRTRSGNALEAFWESMIPGTARTTSERPLRCFSYLSLCDRGETKSTVAARSFSRGNKSWSIHVDFNGDKNRFRGAVTKSTGSSTFLRCT